MNRRGISMMELLVAGTILGGLSLILVRSVILNQRQLEKQEKKSQALAERLLLVKDILNTTRSASNCSLGSDVSTRWLECSGTQGYVNQRIRLRWPTDPQSADGVRKEIFQAGTWQEQLVYPGNSQINVCDAPTRASSCSIPGATFNALAASPRLFRFVVQYSDGGEIETLPFAVTLRNPTPIAGVAYSANTTGTL